MFARCGLTLLVLLPAVRAEVETRDPGPQCVSIMSTGIRPWTETACPLDWIGSVMRRACLALCPPPLVMGVENPPPQEVPSVVAPKKGLQIVEGSVEYVDRFDDLLVFRYRVKVSNDSSSPLVGILWTAVALNDGTPGIGGAINGNRIDAAHAKVRPFVLDGQDKTRISGLISIEDWDLKTPENLAGVYSWIETKGEEESKKRKLVWKGARPKRILPHRPFSMDRSSPFKITGTAKYLRTVDGAHVFSYQLTAVNKSRRRALGWTHTFLLSRTELDLDVRKREDMFFMTAAYQARLLALDPDKRTRIRGYLLLRADGKMKPGEIPVYIEAQEELAMGEDGATVALPIRWP